MSPQALAPLLRVTRPILATAPPTLFLSVLVVFALLQLYRLIETTRERKQRFWLTVPEGPACHSRDSMTEQMVTARWVWGTAASSRLPSFTLFYSSTWDGGSRFQGNSIPSQLHLFINVPTDTRHQFLN